MSLIKPMMFSINNIRNSTEISKSASKEGIFFTIFAYTNWTWNYFYSREDLVPQSLPKTQPDPYAHAALQIEPFLPITVFLLHE